MKRFIKISLPVMLLAAFGAQAEGFLPLGGATDTSHFAIETTASGFVSTEGAILSHGSLPAVSTYSTALESVYADTAADRLKVSVEASTILVDGLDGTASWRLWLPDGRLALAGVLGSDNTIDAADLSAGHYLLQIAAADGSAATFHIVISR